MARFPDRTDPATPYYEQGVIDSLGLMRLIGDIESTFDISFTNKDFNDPRFATLSGLAEMIDGLRQK
jgi:acyl carrier protein